MIYKSLKKRYINNSTACPHHFLICFQCDFKDVTLFGLSQEKEHGLCFVRGGADKYHATLWVIKVILWDREEKKSKSYKQGGKKGKIVPVIIVT